MHGPLGAEFLKPTCSQFAGVSIFYARDRSPTTTVNGNPCNHILGDGSFLVKCPKNGYSKCHDSAIQTSVCQHATQYPQDRNCRHARVFLVNYEYLLPPWNWLNDIFCRPKKIGSQDELCTQAIMGILFRYIHTHTYIYRRV